MARRKRGIEFYAKRWAEWEQAERVRRNFEIVDPQTDEQRRLYALRPLSLVDEHGEPVELKKW